ncbi:hypothetical protein [Microbulbifer litoralis]|uniref:hypothetical protein n=1 Tax=Microbulbifer litoralis TaxID=2933965 RepID=UPI00202900D0|nr:hypothetical protein [Microbulbifer sp. GX H0434]
MNPAKMLLQVFAIGLLLALFAGCSPKHEERKDSGTDMSAPPAGEEQMGATGCCQQTGGSCASPVSESECSDMNGTFVEGQSCDTNTGQCGDSM